MAGPITHYPTSLLTIGTPPLRVHPPPHLVAPPHHHGSTFTRRDGGEATKSKERIGGRETQAILVAKLMALTCSIFSTSFPPRQPEWRCWILRLESMIDLPSSDVTALLVARISFGIKLATDSQNFHVARWTQYLMFCRWMKSDREGVGDGVVACRGDSKGRLAANSRQQYQCAEDVVPDFQQWVRISLHELRMAIETSDCRNIANETMVEDYVQSHLAGNYVFKRGKNGHRETLSCFDKTKPVNPCLAGEDGYDCRQTNPTKRAGGHGPARVPDPSVDPHYNNATAKFSYTTKVNGPDSYQKARSPVHEVLVRHGVGARC
eukprot:749017-Hanusia_phi.AAC.7